MIIHNITITNFKSMYGTHEFDFDTLQGIIKLSGVTGAGKTTLGEAILWGLFGETKDLKQECLVSWKTKTCCIDINLTSRGHEIFIHRDLRQPLEVKIDGKVLAASNKRKTQESLENDYYDVPKMAIERMCIVSFNAFTNSICKLNPHETKQFLDEIFGFNVFTEYNDEIVIERKTQLNENTRLSTVLDETKKQIQYFKDKKEEQQKELENSIDVEALNEKRVNLIEEGKKYKQKKDELRAEYVKKDDELARKITEAKTLGKQEKEYYNTFKSGKCPTCGQPIDMVDLEARKNKMLEYAKQVTDYQQQRNDLAKEYDPITLEIDTKILNLKKEIGLIDQDIKIYEHNLELLKDNYDQIIDDYNNKVDELEKQIKVSDVEIGEWNEMNELFSKTFRYNILNSLIPHINNSIHYFTNKFDLPFNVKFDEEFKAHIFGEGLDDEITYNNLSTGQKKELDVAIIFGILQNVISNLNFNIYFLDELMSNMDTDTRNIILGVIKKNFSSDKTIFVINHAEMQDDYFTHKIRVTLENKKIIDKKKKEALIKCSKYSQIF